MFCAKLYDIVVMRLLGVGWGGGHAHRECFYKWCKLVRFGVYFDEILL